MNKLSIFSIIVTLMCTVSCKNDTKSQKETQETVVERLETAIVEDEKFSNPTQKISSIRDESQLTPRQIIQNQVVNITATEISSLRSQAKSEIEAEWKASSKKSYIIIDNHLFEYQAILAGNDMSKPGTFDGYWIDFNEDLTYTYGHYENIQGGGIFNFNVDNQVILLLDNDESAKPQSFELKIADDTVIFVGKSRYKDANMQGKMVRVEQKPVKS